MKRVFAISGHQLSMSASRWLLGMLMASLAATSALAQATSEQIAARGRIDVATEDDFKPFEFFENGKATGFDTELLELVKKKLAPIDVKQQFMPWPGILPGVVTGKYDAAVTAVLVTSERKGTFTFTTPVAESTTFYAFKKGAAIESAEALRGKVVGVQTGSGMLGDLKAFDAQLKAANGTGIKQIVEYTSYPEAYQDLALGRVDAVANTRINLNSLTETRPGVFVIGQKIGNPVYIAWAVKKGHAGAFPLMNKALLELRASGDLYRLQKKWFGATFESMPQDIN
jgi:polar amino acid transport system substrate-binding protein